MSSIQNVEESRAQFFMGAIKSVGGLTGTLQSRQRTAAVQNLAICGDFAGFARELLAQWVGFRQLLAPIVFRR
jgi:hypothetical protein